jgi:hypothetical protein
MGSQTASHLDLGEIRITVGLAYSSLARHSEQRSGARIQQVHVPIATTWSWGRSANREILDPAQRPLPLHRRQDKHRRQPATRAFGHG